MKMVINHLLSAKDEEAISRVEDNPNEIRVFDLTDIVSLERELDEYDTHFFECLAYLIAEEIMFSRFSKIQPSNGIFRANALKIFRHELHELSQIIFIIIKIYTNFNCLWQFREIYAVPISCKLVQFV